jgi:hypothetical protein
VKTSSYFLLVFQQAWQVEEAMRVQAQKRVFEVMVVVEVEKIVRWQFSGRSRNSPFSDRRKNFPFSRPGAFLQRHQLVFVACDTKQLASLVEHKVMTRVIFSVLPPKLAGVELEASVQPVWLVEGPFFQVLLVSSPPLVF